MTGIFSKKLVIGQSCADIIRHTYMNLGEAMQHPVCPLGVFKGLSKHRVYKVMANMTQHPVLLFS